MNPFSDGNGLCCRPDNTAAFNDILPGCKHCRAALCPKGISSTIVTLFAQDPPKTASPAVNWRMAVATLSCASTMNKSYVVSIMPCSPNHHCNQDSVDGFLTAKPTFFLFICGKRIDNQSRILSRISFEALSLFYVFELR
jgi:hypothetical protein